MSNPNYSDSTRVIANVLAGAGAIVADFVYDWSWAGIVSGSCLLAFAAFQFFVVDRANGYETYGPKRKELPDE